MDFKYRKQRKLMTLKAFAIILGASLNLNKDPLMQGPSWVAQEATFKVKIPKKAL